MAIEVTTWYLEMRDAAQLRPKLSDRADLDIRQAQVPCPEFSRFLYTSVGGQWHWYSRLDWSRERWLAYLSQADIETWVAYIAGTPAGYVELGKHAAGEVEIIYFGLLPQFIGQGLGGHLLTVGVQRAWAMATSRVWVHTCSLDGPHAYKNYAARGFVLYDTQVTVQDLPARSPGF
ncbi:GNAT family N-acetyltransferase [Nodosilinea sp. LEGE 07088]|uniref:GNAT family N-acetyltransferase n=1 Tax=Nodosilinea sp. LEGE 07088 TaxID=2777968 RepID=UPI001881BCAD|nr:GNAT family N-acetyltransferase [Nodosilinea sp. LEGE 07088]MBE9138916.1 GNAT family N-acetyltransferase [Nodosilinea sp. LEGE 07088]